MMTNREVLKDFYNRLLFCGRNLSSSKFDELRLQLVDMQRGVLSGHILTNLIVSRNGGYTQCGFDYFFKEIPTEKVNGSLCGIFEVEFEFSFTDAQYALTIPLVLSSYFYRPLNDK